MRHFILAIAFVFLALVSVRAEEPAATTTPPAAAAKPAEAPKPAEQAAAETTDADEDKKKKAEKTETPAPEAKGKTPGLWQRAVAAMQSGEQHAITLSQRDQTIADLRQQLATRDATISQQLTELNELRAGRDAVENALNALNATPEQRAAAKAGDKTAVASAVTQAAQREAVHVAATQGMPPVPALPEEKNAAEKAQEAFTHAASEPDPRKRAELFAAASDKLMKPSGNN